MTMPLPAYIQITSPTLGASIDKEAVAREYYLVFFIPGNPGPVEYYRTFLSTLHASLNTGLSLPVTAHFEVFGRSIRAVDEEPASGKLHSTSEIAAGIESLEKALCERADALNEEWQHGFRPKVILVGHRSGAYIALELIKRWQMDRPGPSRGLFDVVGAVCLFPSVPVKTFAGTIFQAVLSALSTSASFVHAAAKCLLFLVPSQIVKGLLRATTGLSDDSSKVTSELIGSKWGIYQALALWRNQMEDQKSGRWDDAVIYSNSTSYPPTYMLFGQSDSHSAIGRGRSRLELVAGIHKSQLPDYFFANQCDSQSVARLVHEYVEEIVSLSK